MCVVQPYYNPDNSRPRHNPVITPLNRDLVSSYDFLFTQDFGYWHSH